MQMLLFSKKTLCYHEGHEKTSSMNHYMPSPCAIIDVEWQYIWYSECSFFVYV